MHDFTRCCWFDGVFTMHVQVDFFLLALAMNDNVYWRLQLLEAQQMNPYGFTKIYTARAGRMQKIVETNPYGSIDRVARGQSLTIRSLDSPRLRIDSEAGLKAKGYRGKGPSPLGRAGSFLAFLSSDELLNVPHPPDGRVSHSPHPLKQIEDEQRIPGASSGQGRDVQRLSPAFRTNLCKYGICSYLYRIFSWLMLQQD